MMSRIETENCEFDLEFLPLISKKVSIESFTITGIKTNTDREEDGAIEGKEKSGVTSFVESTAEYIEKEVSSIVSPQVSALKKNTNVDSIIKILDFKSVDKMKNLQSDLENKYDEWNNKISNIQIEDDLKDVESKIKSIDVNKLKKAGKWSVR